MSDIKLNFDSRDIRVIIGFCFMKKMSAKETTEEINGVLGQNSIAFSTVTKWFRMFQFGETSFDDQKREGPPVTVTTEESVAKIKDQIKIDPRITLRQMAEILKISTESIRQILRNNLKARYVCVQWVPHLLTASQMESRLEICQENLKMFELGGKDLPARLVTGDETYVYFYENLTSKEAKLWVLENEEVPKQVRKEIHVQKIMYAVFFRSTGIVKVVKLEKGERVTGEWYVQKCLSQVFAAISEKRRKSGINGIILHHDNARPHKASITSKYLDEMGVKLMRHAPYSPDLSPCDFWLFRNLKKFLRGKRFSSEEELDSAVMGFFESISSEEWRRVYDKWQERMNRCIEVQGDYF